MLEGRIHTLSRSDRIYTNLPSADLVDCTPTTDVVREAHSLQNLSDHVPVRTTLHSELFHGSAQPKIASWISRHAAWPSIVSKLYQEFGVDDDIVLAVQDLKSIFHMAASAV